MTALQLFATDTLDIGTFLRADYSILVRPLHGDLTTTYKSFLAVGTALILLFAVVAPASYLLILFHLRHQLDVRPPPALSALLRRLFNPVKALSRRSKAFTEDQHVHHTSHLCSSLSCINVNDLASALFRRRSSRRSLAFCMRATVFITGKQQR